MTEMRKDRRAPASLKVKYKSATVDEFIEQFGTDVSRGGIFIKTKKPLEAGALLKFEFQLQDGSAVLHGVGRVAWRRLEQHARPDLPAGMGIKFFKLSDHSRIVVERIESRYAGGKSRYEQTDDAEFAPPLSGSPPAADSGAKQLPNNGRRSLSAGSGPLTMPPPPAVSSIPPALAEVPAARPPTPPPRARSRPLSSGLPKGTLGTSPGSFFPEKTPRKSGSPTSNRTRDASEFLASAFQAGGAGPEVRDRARAQAERARRDPESVELARELFGDLGDTAQAQADNGGAAAGGLAAASGGPATPQPDAFSIPTPVPSVELPRSASSGSPRPSLSDRIPSIEQLVEDAGKPEAASPSQRSGARDSAKAAAKKPSPLPAAASRSAGAPAESHVPLTLAISVPTASASTLPPPESRGRSRLLLFAALATTVTLGGVAVFIAMQRGMLGGGSPHATAPTDQPAAPSNETAAATQPETPQPSAAEPQPAAPAPEPGPEVALVIQSKPRGAEVTVAGKSEGVAPAVVKLPSNVPVEVTVKRAGFATLTRSITPSEGGAPELFELAPLSYQVVVRSEPPGATVSALGKSAVSPEPLDLGHIERPVPLSVELEGHQRHARILKLPDFQESDGAMRVEIAVTLNPMPARRRMSAKAAAPATIPNEPPPAPSEPPASAPVMQVTPQAESAPADDPAPAPEPKAAPEPPAQAAAAPEPEAP